MKLLPIVILSIIGSSSKTRESRVAILGQEVVTAVVVGIHFFLCDCKFLIFYIFSN